MKIKLSEIVNNVENIRTLIQVKLPVKISYRISKLVNNQIDRELKNYDEERNKLVKEFGTENEDKTISVKPDRLEEFTTKIIELNGEEVELDWEPLDIESLGDITLEPKLVIPWLFK